MFTKLNAGLLFVLLIFLVAVPNGCKKSKSSDQQNPSPSADVTASDIKPIHWLHDYDAGLKQASENHKPILLAFHADWCMYCNKMKNETYKDPQVIKVMEQFTPVMLDADKEQQLSKTYNIEGLPSYVFLKSDGSFIKKEVGYIPASDFVELLNNILKMSSK